MTIRISYLTIIAFIISTSVLGQAKYYKTPTGKIINSTTYSKLKTDKLEHFKAKFTQVTLEDKLKELYRSNDSIIYSYTWNIKMSGNEKNTTTVVGVEKYIGKELPIKNLTTIDNKSIGLNNIKGKPTLINFWFTTCKACVDEMATLNKIKSTFKDSVNFIAINFEKKDVVTKFLKKHDYDFVQVIDAQNFINEINLTNYPLNVFLDKEGKVVSVENGVPYESKNGGKTKLGDGEKFIKTLRKLL